MLEKGGPSKRREFFNMQDIETINHTNVKNDTALHLAIYTENLILINKLISCTDLTIENRFKQNPLALIISRLTRNSTNLPPDSDKKLHLEKLTDTTVKIINTMKSRSNTLDKCDEPGAAIFLSSIKTLQPKVIDALMDYPGLDLNVKNSDGNNSLMIAINSAPNLIPHLLKKEDIKVNMINQLGESSVYLAIKKAPDYFSTLLDKIRKTDFNINTLSYKNLSVLMLAVKNNKLSCVQQLLSYRPHAGSEPLDIYLTNKKGVSALDIACKRLNVPMSVLLISHFRNLERITGAFSRKYLKIVVPQMASDTIKRAIDILAKKQKKTVGKSHQTKEKIALLKKILNRVSKGRYSSDHLCSHISDQASCRSSYCEWGHGKCQSATKSYLSTLKLSSES